MKPITGKSTSIMAFVKLAPALAAGVLAACLGACSIEKPQAPSWDTEIVLPLINHHYDMIELVDRMAEDGLSYDSLGNLSYSIEQDVDTVTVDACLSISDLAEEFSETLGPIELSNPQAISKMIYLADHFEIGRASCRERV